MEIETQERDNVANLTQNGRLLIIPEQLHAIVPGGIGAFTHNILAELAPLLIRSGVDCEIFGSKWQGSSPDPFGEYGVKYSNAIVHNRILNRLWDYSNFSTPKGFDRLLSLSIAGPLRGGPSSKVYTIYDLAHRIVPETLTPRGVVWHEARLQKILNSTSSVITISNRSLDDLVDAGFDRDRITLVPPGSDHLPVADLLGTDDLLRRVGVSSPFILSVGTMEPRKNLHRVIKALQMARPLLGGEFPLVVVGPSGWGEAIAPTKGVHLVGRVDASILAGLYQRASALVYVPFFEGFGLPPIEAMASATPVVASLLPSTSSENSVIVDPYSIEDISRGIVEVVTDSKVSSRVVREGLITISTMKWSQSALTIGRQFYGI